MHSVCCSRKCDTNSLYLKLIFITSACMEQVWIMWCTLLKIYRQRQPNQWQEGQHPLTGQCAANFRLLANHWAERRLVTQWRHGRRAMRRSVCNAGASNAGRSLCVQILKERSYPCLYIDTTRKVIDCATTLPLSFYTMKRCNRLFVLYCRNCPKYDKLR